MLLKAFSSIAGQSLAEGGRTLLRLQPSFLPAGKSLGLESEASRLAAFT